MELRLLCYAVAVLLTIFPRLRMTQAAGVQFNFSRSELAISERGNLPSQLSIVKTGQHQGNITVDISLTSGVPNRNDYVVNKDHYVFTNDTFELPIEIEILQDRSGESIESFNLLLVLPQQAVSAEIVFPGNVTVTIIDDDAVVMGFSADNSSITLSEGGPAQTVCVDVKPEGLSLDPFDRVPINLRVDPAGGSEDVVIGDNQLIFRGILKRCTTIRAKDNNISDGTRSSYITISVGAGSSAPVEIYPSRIPLTIINDNDEVSFTLISDTLLIASEGERVNYYIKLRKFGYTSLTHTVTLSVQNLTNSADLEDIGIPAAITIYPSANEVDVPVEVSVPHNFVFSEERRKYNVSILEVKAVNGTGALTSVQGDPVQIIVYDNDFEVGFVESQVNITEGSTLNVCVQIFNLQPRDLNPNVFLFFNLAISPNNKGSVQLTSNYVILTALSPVVCFGVMLSDDETFSDYEYFTIQLISKVSNNYDVTFRQQSIVIDVVQQRNTFIGKSKEQETLASSGVSEITILSFLLVLSTNISTIIIIILLIVFYKKLINNNKDTCTDDICRNDPSPQRSDEDQGAYAKYDVICLPEPMPYETVCTSR